MDVDGQQNKFKESNEGSIYTYHGTGNKNHSSISHNYQVGILTNVQFYE